MSTETQAKPQEKKSYKDTLNLPQTSFAMEAKLVQNEPKRLEQWRANRLYERLMEARANSPKGMWVLHDGPPFANGDIHIGHVINKTLKDVVQRFRSMQGHQTPYVPGWDCHGLPIEHKIQEEIKKEKKDFRAMPVVDVRRRCYEYAAKYATLQSEQFQRMGILGEWDRPYLTMAPEYEASTLDVFARFVEAGLVYKQLKPVHWSIANQTALADAELEYQEVTDPSVYVEFPVSTADPKHPNLHLIIWTTTPWTLPANMAIAVLPDGEYAFVDYTRAGNRRTGVVARNLVDRVFKDRTGVTSYTVVDVRTGRDLVGMEYRHPFVPRTGKVLPAEYVSVAVPNDHEDPDHSKEGETKEPGTGLVHTAPGHGEEDYLTGINNGLEVYNPVLPNGRFDATAPEWIQGKVVWEANPLIIQKLRDLDVLFDTRPITHSYPHDWRSKTPTIFRATEQWFVAMDKPFRVESEPEAKTLRQRGVEACTSRVEFIPAWGRNRMLGMLESRPDWCISRQRAWGLPIPVFYNEQGEALLTPASVRAVAQRFGEKGSDAWFTDSPADLLGPDFRYPPGFRPDQLRKEKDIFDVWFESGSSWHAVLQGRDYL